MGLLQKIFGTSSEREIKRIMPQVRATEKLLPEFEKLSEEELKGQTAKLKDKLAQGASLDDILPEAFATICEASRRVLGMVPYHVQIIGGIILHQGRIAEMKTGEGKTLVATLPLYLNALTGKGVHLITVNDYLAKYQSEWMGKVFRYLGLEVGLVIHGIEGSARKKAYAADITYGTNNEFGFDYLRDNMATSLEQQVQRELNFAIVDEVDSILIDEARTPLIISGPGDSSSELYASAQQFVSRLKRKIFKEVDDKLDYEEIEAIQGDADYVIDEKAKTAVLTKRGIEKAEQYFKVENLADQSNYKLNHHINNALKANGIMHRDQDYVIQDEEVLIVDDFTGRLMPGRRYSNGLHQAIEAKEHVKVRRESRTLATITFQNYFRMYGKLSGMTGTAMTEKDEFEQIYRLDVVEIPTNKPVIRKDMDDEVYKTTKGKYQRLVEEVQTVHAKGQPVLIGTVSVEKSELISDLFTRVGLPHNVLNAKHHAQEAEIVAQAGRLGAITVATNMAGRGTDILLGGNPEHLAKQAMRKEGVLEEFIEEADTYNETDDENILKAREQFARLSKEFKKETDQEKEKVIAAGGLYIMGTERHESRRIDNQLRGRAGRQGDPGMSKFFISLEDDLMRLFGGQRMENIFATMGIEETMEIKHPMLSRGIESAQKRVESQNFAIRRYVLEYDDVMNQQRSLIYRQRTEVLEGKDLHEFYTRIIPERIQEVMLDFAAGEPDSFKWDRAGLYARMTDLIGELPILERIKSDEELDGEEFTREIQEAALKQLESRIPMFGGEEEFRKAERYVLLSAVDNHWMEHIDAMDTLRDSIGVRAYGQQDPVVAYKKEGFDMFEMMTDGIQEDAVRMMMRAQVLEKEAEAQTDSSKWSAGKKAGASSMSDLASAKSGSDERMAQAQAVSEAAQEPAKREHMLGRNDPCWCGSGKKYKKCHMKSDQANS